MTRLLVADELCGPHLVLADTCNVVGVRSGNIADPRNHLLGCNQTFGWLVVSERERCTPLVDLMPPGFIVSDPSGDVLGLNRRHKIDDDLARIADDWHICRPVFADLCRINIGMDDGRVRSERWQIAGHPIVEASTQGNNQVAPLQRAHCGNSPVHPRHAKVLLVGVWEGTARHQRRHDRNPG